MIKLIQNESVVNNCNLQMTDQGLPLSFQAENFSVFDCSLRFERKVFLNYWSIIFLNQNGWNLFQGFPGYIHREHNFFEYRQWNNLLLKSSNIPAKAGISISAVFPYVPRCCVNIFQVCDFNSLNSSCFWDLFCHKSDTNLLTMNHSA